MSFVGAVPFARTRFDLRTTTLTRLMGALARALDTTLEWRERARQRRRLAALDARMLADIGITWAAALSEAEQPFWWP